jgi:hypothetical protein
MFPTSHTSLLERLELGSSAFCAIHSANTFLAIWSTPELLIGLNT